MIWNPNDRLRNVLLKEFYQSPHGYVYSSSEYTQAADILKIFKPLSYTKAVKMYPKKLIDLLILTAMISPMGEKLTRIVSIKAIKVDTEAGWGE